MFINGSNVGIGTTSASNALSVAGTVSATVQFLPELRSRLLAISLQVEILAALIYTRQAPSVQAPLLLLVFLKLRVRLDSHRRLFRAHLAPVIS